jgi:hypothetical protein
MLFCTAKHAEINSRRATWIGTHYLLSDSPLGPFELAPEPLLLAGTARTSEAARAHLEPRAGHVIMAFRRFDEHGQFAGELIDPIPLIVDPIGGRLTVAPLGW